MKIVLPWPSRTLSPNSRAHWRQKAAAVAKARQDAGWATYAAKGCGEAQEGLNQNEDPIPVTMTFYPPDRRHRDDDNMISSAKALRDGIADALGVNDRRFRTAYHFGEPEKPGRVEVEIKLVETSDLT